MIYARFILTSFYFFLNGCFQIPVSSQGRVSVLDGAPRIVASTNGGENKSVARIDASSKVALTVEAPAGNLSGSSIVIPSGALTISADLVIEEAIPLAQTSVTSSLQLDGDLVVKTVGAGLIIRPTASVNLSQSLIIAMPLDSTLPLWALLRRRLHLQGEKTYAVFYKQFVKGELRAGVIPTSDISFPGDGTAVFSGYFGSYWLAEVSKSIEAKQEINTDEPMVNIAQVAVIEKSGIVEEETIQTKTAIPVLVWATPKLSADAASRTFTLKASLAGSGEVSECFADLFPSRDAQTGLNLKAQADLTVSYKIESTLAYTFVGRMRCLDGHGRQTVSEWSESVSLVALKPAILSRAPLVVKTGELVTLTGQNFRRSMSVLLNGQVVKDLQILSENLATFIVPSSLDFGLASVAFAQDGTSQTVSLIYQAGQDELPIIMLPPNEVCAGRSYYDKSGKLMTGGKVCDAVAAACTADGQASCLVDGTNYKAAALTGAADKILAGQTLAGVAGTITLPAVGKVLTGTSFGVGGAGSTGTLTLPTAANVLSGSAAYGEPGAQLTPSLSPDFPSVANVRTIDTVNGATGTLADCNAGNLTGCVTTSTYISMNLSAASAMTDLSSSNFNATIATAANFEFWDSTGARYQVTGDSDLSAGNVKSGVSLFGVSGDYPSATYPLASNTAATDLTFFTTQLTTDGSFEFFDSAGAKYTGSGDSDLVAANVKSGVNFENLSITGTSTATFNCPTGWIKVPGDSAYGTNDFCVMKYEAKNVGGVATSQAASTPWVVSTQTAAITSCRALGTGYDLISNAQWMTIGANVAARAGNWTGGVVGTGYLFSGHNDNSPASACAASSDDSLFYVETDCTAVSSGDTTEQRRTLTLSNGAVIWDFSGNVFEWVNYINRGDKPGATNAYYEYSALTGTTTTALKDLVPTNAVKAFWSDSWNSGKWVGKFYPATNDSGGALQRGGSWLNGSYAGVFAANLSSDPSGSGTAIGLRCVLTAPGP